MILFGIGFDLCEFCGASGARWNETLRAIVCEDCARRYR